VSDPPGRACTGTVDLSLDVFSALIDSRTGASPVLDRIATRQRWHIDGEGLYLARDRAHKALQLECARWESFASLGRRAMARVLEERQLYGDVDAAMAELWASLGDWPLWPDSGAGRPGPRAPAPGRPAEQRGRRLARPNPGRRPTADIGPGRHLAAGRRLQAEVKVRCTRSAGRWSAWAGVVVRRGVPRTTPAMTSSRIGRATRSRPTTMPPSAAAARPYGPRRPRSCPCKRGRSRP
jgi:hypothetical protein